MTLDIKRILVPVDFSGNSARALSYAHGLALKFDAALHLVHVCEVPSMITASMDGYAIAYGDWSQRLGEEAERELTKMKSGLGGVTVTTEVLFGTAAMAILEDAELNGVDLIVMGTHGHGALMHVLMGSVAERIVRTSTRPVLTVRDAQAKEAAVRVPVKARTASFVAAMLVAGVMLAPGSVSAANAQEYKQSNTGGETYRMYCASCHGTAARGDGPLASAMRKKPADLTEIAKRNGGLFPSEMVFKTIDGRQPVRGHGGPDMPVWGDAFSKAHDGGDEARVKSVIQSLVDFLEGLQLRSGHEQQ